LVKWSPHGAAIPRRYEGNMRAALKWVQSLATTLSLCAAAACGSRSGLTDGFDGMLEDVSATGAGSPDPLPPQSTPVNSGSSVDSPETPAPAPDELPTGDDSACGDLRFLVETVTGLLGFLVQVACEDRPFVRFALWAPLGRAECNSGPAPRRLPGNSVEHRALSRLLNSLSTGASPVAPRSGPGAPAVASGL
jgi:hypothetical protein